MLTLNLTKRELRELRVAIGERIDKLRNLNTTERVEGLAVSRVLATKLNKASLPQVASYFCWNCEHTAPVDALVHGRCQLCGDRHITLLERSADA